MKTTQVQRLVYKMLTENTGSHICDSGGAYGRHHERNRKRTIKDFINEPEVTYEFDPRFKELNRTVSVFHYLCGLELDDICDKFNRRNTNCKDWDGEIDGLNYNYGISKRAADWFNDQDFVVESVWSINTYNGESDLSQVLQYELIKIDGDEYFLMQIHQGCDVRGGYTDVKLFKQSYWGGHIHEYLSDYMDQSELENELEEGYIESATHYYDRDVVFTNQQMIDMINGIKKIDDMDEEERINLAYQIIEGTTEPFGYMEVLVKDYKSKAELFSVDWKQLLAEEMYEQIISDVSEETINSIRLTV